MSQIISFYRITFKDLLDRNTHQKKPSVITYLRDFHSKRQFSSTVQSGVGEPASAHRGGPAHPLPGTRHRPPPGALGGGPRHPGGGQGHRPVPPGRAVHRRDGWEAHQPHPAGEDHRPIASHRIPSFCFWGETLPCVCVCCCCVVLFTANEALSADLLFVQIPRCNI